MARQGDNIGPYTLLEKLGRGGFGVVWLAEKRTALATRKVAIKLPNDDDVDLDAIRREAALWIEVSDHPNILSFIDADIYDEQIVIVSEYAPDGSLAQLLKQNGGKMPSENDAIEMTKGILEGLAHLHSKRIIHRDLKPANILLNGLRPRLVDFGLARVMKSTSNSRTVSGTYAYMPPETFEGSRSEQTDVYSTGVILYEMLTGRLPFPQDNDAALIGAILHKEPDALPQTIRKHLHRIINRAMEKDLNNRYKSAEEMAVALSDLSFLNNETNEAKTEILNFETLGEQPFSQRNTLNIEAPDDETISPYQTKEMSQNITEASPLIPSELRLKQTEKLPTFYTSELAIQEAQLTQKLNTVSDTEDNLTFHAQQKVSLEDVNDKSQKPLSTVKEKKQISNIFFVLLGIGTFILVFAIGRLLLYLLNK